MKVEWLVVVQVGRLLRRQFQMEVLLVDPRATRRLGSPRSRCRRRRQLLRRLFAFSFSVSLAAPAFGGEPEAAAAVVASSCDWPFAAQRGLLLIGLLADEVLVRVQILVKRSEHVLLVNVRVLHLHLHRVHWHANLVAALRPRAARVHTRYRSGLGAQL